MSVGLMALASGAEPEAVARAFAAFKGVEHRLEEAGTVRGVRVEGPAILQKNGLYGCIKGVVGRLRFPAAGTSQILSYPFRLS